MDFSELLQYAQRGNEDSAKEILQMYTPLLYHKSLCSGILDEDLFQELNATLMVCIRTFRV